MAEYIEREAVLAEYDRQHNGPPGGARKIIAEFPAADVAPVKHGAPIKFFNDPYTGRMFTTCSICDGKISPKDKWCRHCGAKMDKEVYHGTAY